MPFEDILPKSRESFFVLFSGEMLLDVDHAPLRLLKPNQLIVVDRFTVDAGPTRIDRIGKNDGGLENGTPKYLDARFRSNSRYLAFAGKVHGGLFPNFAIRRR